MRCDACKFHEKGRRDLCRRYPGPTFTTPGGWCGEWEESVEAAFTEAKDDAKKRKGKKRG